jgi:hypothetical protein
MYTCNWCTQFGHHMALHMYFKCQIWQSSTNRTAKHSSLNYRIGQPLKPSLQGTGCLSTLGVNTERRRRGEGRRQLPAEPGSERLIEKFSRVLGKGSAKDKRGVWDINIIIRTWRWGMRKNNAQDENLFPFMKLFDFYQIIKVMKYF